MKSKLLITIVLIVAGVHLTLFLLTQRDDTPPAEAISRSDSLEPIEPVSAETAPPSEMKNASTQVVTDAVELIRERDPIVSSPPIGNEAPRPTSVVPLTRASTPASSETKPEADATLVVGRVEGNSKLPPELREVAEEGAKAVAGQNWERARELYLRMVKEAPENALGYANLGVAEHQLGNLLAAAGNLRKSLDLNPSIAQNWQTLGIIRYERGELELAISSLTRAIHEDPSDARSRLYLAAVIRSYGWIEASITELERAVETDPKFADAHFNLAMSYLEVDPPKTELARRHYFSAIDLGAASSSEIEALLQNRDTNE